MTLAISIVCAAIAAKLFYDYRLWLKKKPVNHGLEWLILAAVCAYPVYLFTVNHSEAFYMAGPLSAIMVMGFIWFWFDGLYNAIRGYDWWFTGTDDADDAKSDKLLKSMPRWQQIFVKLTALLLPIIIYLITFR